MGPEVTDWSVVVFPDEDGVGQVNIWMYFNGKQRMVRKNDPSLYCEAAIQLAEYVRDLPLYAPDAFAFDAREAATACVIEWFVECWRAAGGEEYRYPVEITGHEGWGTPDLIPLTRLSSAGLTPSRGLRLQS